VAASAAHGLEDTIAARARPGPRSLLDPAPDPGCLRRGRKRARFAQAAGHVCGDAEVPERIGPGQQIAGLLRERVGLLELQNRSVLLTPDHLVHDADPEPRLPLAANVVLVSIQQRGALASTPSSPRSASASPLGSPPNTARS